MPGLNWTVNPYMLPEAYELDLTPFWAPFFMVSFGLCLRDSGYGFFLFGGNFTAYRRMAKSDLSMKSILSLIQVLAVSTFFLRPIDRYILRSEHL